VDTATHVEIEGVEDWTGSSHGEHGTELDAALSVKEVRTLSGDTDYYVGEAFKQREEEFDATTGAVRPIPGRLETHRVGNDVLDDPDVGKLLSGAVRSNVLNQVAGRYVWDGSPLPHVSKVGLRGGMEPVGYGHLGVLRVDLRGGRSRRGRPDGGRGDGTGHSRRRGRGGVRVREKVEVHVTTSAELEGDLRDLLLQILVEDGVDPVSELASRADVELSEASMEPGEIYATLAVLPEDIEDVEGVEEFVVEDEDDSLERKAAKTSDLSVDDSVDDSEDDDSDD